MPKKSSVNISAIAVIRIIVFLFIGFILFTLYTRTLDFLTHSPLFEVKEVLIDASIQFIDTRSLKQLKGQNIFKVNMKKIERQLAGQYPNIAQLRVVRQFPNRIKILAKKRTPLFQVGHKGKFLLVDSEGTALYYALKPVGLPQVKGILLDRTRVVLGTPLAGGQPLAVAVDILNLFKNSRVLNQWVISEIHVGNLSKIDIIVGNGVHVIVDQDNTLGKIASLQMLAAQHKIDLMRVKYVDVRFNEPVIADHVEVIPESR